MDDEQAQTHRNQRIRLSQSSVTVSSVMLAEMLAVLPVLTDYKRGDHHDPAHLLLSFVSLLSCFLFACFAVDEKGELQFKIEASGREKRSCCKCSEQNPVLIVAWVATDRPSTTGRSLLQSLACKKWVWKRKDKLIKPLWWIQPYREIMKKLSHRYSI